MRHGIDLLRLPFSVVERTMHLPTILAANGIATAPEIQTVRLVSQIPEPSRYLPVFDFEETAAGELEVIALMINAPGVPASDKDAVLCITYYIVQGRTVFARC